MTRDHCSPTLTFNTNSKAKTIISITLRTTNNTCGAPIPITVPGSVTDTQGFTTEQIGTGKGSSANPCGSLLTVLRRPVDHLGYYGWSSRYVHFNSSGSILKSGKQRTAAFVWGQQRTHFFLRKKDMCIHDLAI